MITVELDQPTPTVVVATVLVQREGTTEASDLAEGFADARDEMALVLGLRTSTWSTVVLSAIPGRRLFEVTFRNCEDNTDEDEDEDVFENREGDPAFNGAFNNW